MFERYTEKARRAIFFSRSEASQFGSSYIEPEHLLLGLVHQTVGWGFPAITFDAIRNEIEKITPRGTPFPTSVDLPVSSPVKRALRRAEKEADESGQQEIGVEHLLLGLLAEDDSIVPRILQKYGIDRESVLREIRVNPPSRQPAPEQPGKAPPDRESLRALVDSLPDGALQGAQRTLEHMQTWPPVRPPLPARIAELTQEMGERARRGLKPGTMGGGGRGGSWRTDAEGRLSSGRYSSTRREGWAEVVETHTFHDGHEITLIERFRLSEDGKTLSYTQEISGPRQSTQHTIDFDVS
jgi:hypothetical protein